MNQCECNNANDKLIGVRDAKKILFANLCKNKKNKIISIDKALGRILAKPIKAKVSNPSFDNSAMDGFAICFDEVKEKQNITISDRIPAGSPIITLQKNTATRIFTGAPIPRGADTVVKQEDCEYDQNNLIIKKKPKKGANIRYIGEDFNQNDILIDDNKILQPQDIALAVASGNGTIHVKKRLKVAIFSNGDELLQINEKMQTGKIYDSNSYMLQGLLKNPAIKIINLGVIKDNLEDAKKTILKAASLADLILTSGGVSVGEEDHIKNAIQTTGSLDMWKIKIRPGKPLAFGKVKKIPIIGIPGNPVALFVSFLIFIKPYILKSLGISDVEPVSYKVKSGFSWDKPDIREEYIRAKITINEKKEQIVHSFPSRSSGVISSLCWANGLVRIPPKKTFKKNDKVDFIPFCI
jgi:molybdopterin molybdotransferase